MPDRSADCRERGEDEDEDDDRDEGEGKFDQLLDAACPDAMVSENGEIDVVNALLQVNEPDAAAVSLIKGGASLEDVLAAGADPESLVDDSAELLDAGVSVEELLMLGASPFDF